MLRRLLSFVWTVLMLPIKLVLLPFKIFSTIMSLVFYLSIVVTLGAIVYFLVL